MEWNKICCAVDFSEPSRLALTQASELARRLQGKLTLLHVVEVPAAASVLPGRPPIDEKVTADAERTMEAWRAEAEELSRKPVLAKLLIGDVAAEIVSFARANGFDLLVLGNKGRTSLVDLVLGSVAERLTRQAPCSLLIARPREAGEAEKIKEEVAQYQAG